MKNFRYVILGGGLVAGYAAQAFVAHGVRPHELAIISAESHLPYERPPLSKAFLLGQRTCPEILINPPTFYEEHGIEVVLETSIERVDFTQKRLHSKSETISYEKLLIATGARVRPLTMPAAEVAGIYYLRTLDDAKRLQIAATTAKQAVVIGGSFIGMEVAAVLQQLGVKTTLVFPGSHVWETFLTTRMANFFEQYYCAQGVTMRRQSKVVGIHSEADHVSHVSLANGQDLPADLVVVGIGASPAVELFAGTELALDDGIVVNQFLETNVPDVYAAGDVARYPDRLFQDKLRRVEHWDNAVAQGKHVAGVMCGEREEFIHLPYFFSDLFDLSYEFWGDNEGAETVVYRGDIAGGAFSSWWLSPTSRLLAAFVMNRPPTESTLAQQWIKTGMPLNALVLRDPAQPLDAVPD